MSSRKSNVREQAAQETRELAQKLAVGERQARRLKAELGGDGGDELKEAKLKKILLECQKLQHQIDVAQGLYILRSQVREDGLRVGNIFTSELESLKNDGPGLLAGLSELEVRKKLDTRVEELKEIIRKEIASTHESAT